MNAKRLRVHPLLLLLLLGVLVAAIFAPEPERVTEKVVQAAGRPPTQSARRDNAASQAAVSVAAGTVEAVMTVTSKPRFTIDGHIIDIFAVPHKPMPKVERAVPTTPTAPPFDYQYMGRVIDQSEQSLFFTRARRPYVIRPGETLDGNFLLESVNGKVAVFIYVPLSIRQTVVLGGE